MNMKIAKSEKILSLLKSGVSAPKVAKRLRVSKAYVYQVRYKDKARKQRLDKKIIKKLKTAKDVPIDTTATKIEGAPATFDVSTDQFNAMLAKATGQTPDPLFHYTVGGIENWDFIEAKALNYNLGNAVSLIARSSYRGRKLQDLKNAAAYLNREISLIEAARS